MTLDEVVEKSGYDRATVTRVMWKLVRDGIIKCFLKEGDKGELLATYIIL